jgi:hypothetical protein
MAMISEQARRSLEHIFIKAAATKLVLAPLDVCEVAPLVPGRAEGIREKNLLLLTISAFSFRLLTILQAGENAKTREYYLKGAPGRTFGEVFAEVGNLCCGSMNRQLTRHFPHLGMSVPYFLDSRCIPYLNELKPEYLSSCAITINGSATLHATLCVCAYAPVDFAVDPEAEEETTGELELF